MRAQELIGTVLSGKYRVDATLGVGGQSSVYRGRHIYLDMDVAVKVLPFRANAERLRRFYREGKLASQLSHPNNTKVHDLGHTDDGVVYLVMELVDGRPLGDLETPMAARRALGIARQVCGALSEAHRLGIIHRDLKPANVMVSQVDGEDFVHVLDYGLAKPVNDPDPLTGDCIVGTPQYMSPEQASGIALCPRSDLYSLGVILFELLVGRPPFSGRSSIALMNAHMAKLPPNPGHLVDLDHGVEQLVMMCLEKNPDARPQSAVELRQRLDAAL